LYMTLPALPGHYLASRASHWGQKGRRFEQLNRLA
jgi:hypothetical protein